LNGLCSKKQHKFRVRDGLSRAIQEVTRLSIKSTHKSTHKMCSTDGKPNKRKVWKAVKNRLFMNRKNKASFKDEVIKKDNAILPRFCSGFGC